MGLIKEPLNVDFYVDPRPLTKKKGKLLVSTFGNTKKKWLNLKVAEPLLRKKVY